MGFIVKYILLATLFVSCIKLPDDVEISLSNAGNNKSELKKVLRHYNREKDSLKFKAACFLISNMRWHYNDYPITDTDQRLDKLLLHSDSIYHSIYGNHVLKNLSNDSLKKLIRHQQTIIRDSIRNIKFTEPTVSAQIIPDLLIFNNKSLISHIDNAFQAWSNNPMASALTFEDFCEWILPYRSIGGGPASDNYVDYKLLYSKYFSDASSPNDYVQIYNHRIKQGREFGGKYPLDYPCHYSLCFREGNCVALANYCSQILRACGVPVRVEYNASYRMLGGRHYVCVIRDSSRNEYQFNPESGLINKWNYGTCTNIYRLYFAAQPDSPYFIEKDNYIPPHLASPCIKDVTSERRNVYRITLPFPGNTHARLAYLACFQNNGIGLIPVTWGKIDSVSNQVEFLNILPGLLYFPLYYDNGVAASFYEPFSVKADSITNSIKIEKIGSRNTNNIRGDILVTRKFPVKENMLRVANSLVGGRFQAANKADYSDSVNFYTIKTPPSPYWQEVVLNNSKPYYNYRYIGPKAEIAEIEFITSRSYRYPDAIPPTPVTVLSPKDSLKNKSDLSLVHIPDSTSWSQMKKRAVYDGNMETSFGPYRTVRLALNKPKVVTRIRFAPRNADNGIKRGNNYELMYWNNGWTSCAVQTAKYEYLLFHDIPLGKLYWLKNLSRGKEELPFTIEDGKQKFIYEK